MVFHICTALVGITRSMEHTDAMCCEVDVPLDMYLAKKFHEFGEGGGHGCNVRALRNCQLPEFAAVYHAIS